MCRCSIATAILFVAAVTGCGDDGGTSDASIVIDIDNGSCGDTLRFTGEYVDWDTNTQFCGIGDATVDEEGDGATSTTAPNGRFDLCIQKTSVTTKLIVTQPSGNSMCTTPPSGYSTPTILVANRDVIQAGGFFSGSSFTTARQQTFFQSIGVPFDPNKAQVHVYVNGTPHKVSLAATHAAPQAIMTSTWGAGDLGKDVFFPNVDVGTGTTTLTVEGGAIGTGSIPLIAGTITNVSVLVH